MTTRAARRSLIPAAVSAVLLAGAGVWAAMPVPPLAGSPVEAAAGAIGMTLPDPDGDGYVTRAEWEEGWTAGWRESADRTVAEWAADPARSAAVPTLRASFDERLGRMRAGFDAFAQDGALCFPVVDAKARLLDLARAADADGDGRLSGREMERFLRSTPLQPAARIMADGSMVDDVHLPDAP